MASIDHIVEVGLGPRSYSIQIGTGLLHDAGKLLRQLQPSGRFLFISDQRVAAHTHQVATSLSDLGIPFTSIEIPSGESSKSIEQLTTLWNQMLAQGVDRQTTVVAIGGGVTGDLAGFAAASFARGIDFVQVPTTLLAQVDSSVGGKVGINLPRAKNMVGAFWQPRGVLIDLATLATLAPRDYRSGLAEVVKYGVIMDPPFFEFLETHAAALLAQDPDVLGQVIAQCCRLKAQVVEQDERESGLRAILNYGHTFAHAIETLTDYGAYLHGEAVSMGMVCASRLAERLGMIPTAVTQRQVELLTTLELPTMLPCLDTEAMLSVMASDKKANQGQIRFILPTRMGEVQLVDDADLDQVRQVLRESRSEPSP